MQLLFEFGWRKKVQRDGASMEELVLVENQFEWFGLVPVNQVNDYGIGLGLGLASHHRNNAVMVALKHDG